jgi:hypothetical protein
MSLVLLDRGEFISDTLCMVDNQIDKPFVGRKQYVSQTNTVAVMLVGELRGDMQEVADDIASLLVGTITVDGDVIKALRDYVTSISLSIKSTMYIGTKTDFYTTDYRGKWWSVCKRDINGVIANGTGADMYMVARQIPKNKTPMLAAQTVARNHSRINNRFDHVVLSKLKAIKKGGTK